MAEPVLEADGVCFAYGRVPVLDRVSFALKPGEFAALVGPNGSGKSTLLRILLGLLPPVAGEVRILGVPPAGLEARWRLGYVPQRTSIPDDFPGTVEEVVAAGRLARRGWFRRLGRQDRDEIEHALGAVDMVDLRRRRVSELSGGQQQRVLIAKALVTSPELLVLDEPVAGVDSDSQQRFRDALVHLQREHGAAVLLVSHELSAVAAALDRVLVLQRGGIVFDGTPDDFAATGVSLGVHATDLPVWLEESR